jgi:hypothetical protein
MVLYLRTDRTAAKSILQHGFRDGTGYYLTDQLWKGVWLASERIDENDGAFGDVLLKVPVKLPKKQIEQYEWVEIDKGCREFLIPASVLNPACVVKVVEVRPRKRY